MRILVVNAGSSSLKHSVVVLPGGALEEQAVQRWDPGAPAGRHAEALRAVLAGAGQAPDAIGHRVVHGGSRFRHPVAIDARVRAAIAALVELAPLHNGAALEGIEAATAAFPHVPQIACFDTAFHRTIHHAAATYAIPRDWAERYAIRRYGFHGLNVEWCAGRAAELLGPAATRRLVVCHLGSGCSVTAVRDGRSADTTMGFTPLDGVPMATRPGALDPGIQLHLLEHGVAPAELARRLTDEAGLLGISGLGVREVVIAAASGDARAALALAVFVRGVAGAVAAMTTAIGGLDCLVFTGGAGEGSPHIRAAVAERLAHLGVALDGAAEPAAAKEAAAGADAGDRELTAAGAQVRTLVIRAREDLAIARHVAALLEGQPPSDGPRARHESEPSG